jgi:hypothetical protein
MVARRMKRVTVVHIGMLLALAACQTTGPMSESIPLDDRTFMGLWRTYLHCRITDDADAKLNDARRLDLVVRAVVRREEVAPLLPEALQALIEELPSRAAVDPGAMAAACALHAGEAAQTAGRYEEAVELFRFIGTAYAEPKYAYYAARAQQNLARIAQDPSFAGDGAQKIAQHTLRQAQTFHDLPALTTRAD